MSESGLSSPAAVSTPSRLSLFLDRAGLQGFPWVSAIVLYTISWGWILIVRDSYWADDWFLFPRHASTFPIPWDSMGFAPWLKYQVPIFWITGPGFFHTLTFFSYFIIGILLFGIVNREKIIDSRNQTLFAHILLLTPLNTARIYLATTPYTIGFLLFCVAWHIMQDSDSKIRNLVSYLLFFLSFMFHSLLFFIFLPVYFSFRKCKIKKYSDVLAWLKQRFFLLLLPPFYVVMRSYFWPERIRYHDPSFDSFKRGLVSILAFSAVIVLMRNAKKRFISREKSLELISVAFVSLFLGALPFIVLGFFDNYVSFAQKNLIVFFGRSDLYSRHQNLLGLGIALLFLGLKDLVPKFRDSVFRKFPAFFLTILICFNLGFGFEHVVDYQKQTSIIEKLNDFDINESNLKFEFVDQSVLLNARGRIYRSNSDWQGLIWRAYGVDAWQSHTAYSTCQPIGQRSRLVLIQGPETHWQALKNWVRDRDMGFNVTVDDTPGACKPEMVTPEKVSGAIPILFYFTGVKN